jgi:hypothetical protein
MRIFLKICFSLLIITIFSSKPLIAQIKDPTWAGSVDGSVKDSVLNYFMQAATVTIYKVRDSSLVAYTLTNSLGEFHLKGIPTDTALKVIVSYIGYKTRSQFFRITGKEKMINLRTIFLEKRPDDFQDSVVVTPPPVRMKGDTLEFSAAAFSLDKNAVAEDLLKKLPGVIVWGDGTITVNGRQISQLLVDGKPFFGGDTKIATQNIPKEAIEKVQVYQEQVNPLDPLDSITTINLKLRKNKHAGYFGAFSAGAGSHSKYEAGANSNSYNARTQFGLAAQSNNINKIANDIGTLFRNNTYKGVSAQVEYQPDFNLQGRNQPTSGGFIFSHDFIPDLNKYKEDRLTVNSFIDHNINETTKQLHTVSYIGNDSALTQDNTNNLKSITTGVNLHSHYVKHKDENTWAIDGSFDNKNTNIQDSLENAIYGPGLTLLSNDHEHDSNTNSSHTVSLAGSLDHHGFSSTNIHRLADWTASYSVSFGSTAENRIFRTSSTSFFNPLMNRFYNRKYDNGSNNMSQSISAQVGDFSAWLFGRNRKLSPFHIQLKNELKFDLQKQDNAVGDKDSLSNAYLINTYLSKQSQYTVINEIPDLRFGRSFLNVLANRYQKELSIYVDAKMQIYSERNTSTHLFQNFNTTYNRPIPTASLAYSKFYFGDHLDRYNLDFNMLSDYPTADQRFPLVDSADIFSIRAGNPLLKPQNKYELSFKFRHDNYNKNTLAYGGAMAGGIKQHYFADSVIVDPSGRYTYYTVNLNGNRYLSVNFFLNKAFVFDSHQFQVNFGSIFEKSRNPGYLQYQIENASNFNVSQTFTNSDTISVYYTYKDKLAINVLQNLSYYRSSQYGFTNAVLTNSQSVTRVGASLNVTKKLALNSNVSYNWSLSSGAAANNYTIWNASVAYRFLQANNLELKFSALDLLNQNKGIINYGDNYSFTHGTVNMLRQYFMMTLTYFPRKF